MKFMLHMNVPKGPYQMPGWSPDDIKRMVGFMHQTNADLKAAGQLVAAEGLVSPEEARLVKANDDGTPSVTDGPFAESKEFIAGFWIVEVKNADEAYKIAARISTCPGPGLYPQIYGAQWADEHFRAGTYRASVVEVVGELDVGQACHSAPEDFSAGMAIATTSQVAHPACPLGAPLH